MPPDKALEVVGMRLIKGCNEDDLLTWDDLSEWLQLYQQEKAQGLPGKNIKDFNGKPLIIHTIESALEAKNITDVFVSTDSKVIAISQ